MASDLLNSEASQRENEEFFFFWSQGGGGFKKWKGEDRMTCSLSLKVTVQ